jgi:hypothetical protein
VENCDLLYCIFVYVYVLCMYEEAREKERNYMESVNETAYVYQYKRVMILHFEL